MIVGQDWCSEKEIARAVTKGDKSVFEQGFSRRFQTNHKIDKLLCKHLHLKRSDCWLTNVFPFIKPKLAQSRIRRGELKMCAKRFTLREINIIQPKLVICLGLETYIAMRRVIGVPGSPKLSYAIKDKPMHHNSARIVCVAHPGVWGLRNRGKEQVDRDWKRIAELYNRIDAAGVSCAARRSR